MKIAVAGTGYVGLSVALLNNGKSPIVDPVITDFLMGNASGERPLDFHATIDAQEAYTDADFAVIATPTNYDEKKNYFDTSSVETAIEAVRQYSPHAWIVIKSTIPVGYTQMIATNSPFFTSSETLFNAVVSTSSVRNTLLKFSIFIIRLKIEFCISLYYYCAK